MANTQLGAGSCNDYSNTLIGSCVGEPSLFVYAVLVPKGTVIPNSALVSQAAFNTYVTARFIADTNRWKLLPLMTDLKDNTGDTVMESRNNYQFPVQDKPYDWEYRLSTTLCGYKKAYAIAHNKQDSKDVFFIDDQNSWAMTPALDSSALAGGGAFAMANIWMPIWTQKTASTNPKYMIRFNLLSNLQMSPNAIMMASTFVVNNAIDGLADVTLIPGTTATTATHTYVKGTIGCGGSSLGVTYGNTLAVTPVWVVKNAATGATITVAAASYDAINDQYDLTLTSATGLTVVVALAAPSVMTATPYFAYIITEVPDKLTVIVP